MKKIILSATCLLILWCNSTAQHLKNSLYTGPQFNFGFELGWARHNAKAALNAGLNFERSAVELQANLYAAPVLVSFGGSSGEGTYELGLLYGKFWDFGRSRLQVNAGLSWIRNREQEYRSSEWQYTNTHAIGIPADVRFYFRSGKHFAWGLKAFTNINSRYTLTGAGLVFSFRD